MPPHPEHPMSAQEILDGAAAECRVDGSGNTPTPLADMVLAGARSAYPAETCAQCLQILAHEYRAPADDGERALVAAQYAAAWGERCGHDPCDCEDIARMILDQCDALSAASHGRPRRDITNAVRSAIGEFPLIDLPPPDESAP